MTEGEPAAPIDGFSFAEREPSWWEWYFVSGTEPHRDVVADPWVTWELRTHLGQPATPPTTPPVTLEQKRVAYNIAVSTGDAARADALYAEITRELRPVHASFEDGTEIVGTTFHEAARPLLTIFVKAGGPMAPDAQLSVKSQSGAYSMAVTEGPAGTRLPAKLLGFSGCNAHVVVVRLCQPNDGARCPLPSQGV